MVAWRGLLSLVPSLAHLGSMQARNAPLSDPLQPLAGYSLRILPLGDSITYGWRSSTGDGYREDLIQDLRPNNTVQLVGSQEHGSMADSENEGHSGYRIDQIAEVTNASLASNPDVVLLHAGTNDMIQNYQVDTAPERLGMLIDQILSIVPHTALLVAQIIPTPDEAVQQRCDAYNAQIPRVVQARADQGSQVMTVDMSHLLDTHTDYKDLWHPNDQGYAKMATAWYHGLEAANGRAWLHNATAGNITVTQSSVNPTLLPPQLTPGARIGESTIPGSVAAATTTGGPANAATSGATTTASASAGATHSSGAARGAVVPLGGMVAAFARLAGSLLRGQ